MQKIHDNLFCQTWKCVCSKWNCLACIFCFNACHVACSLLTSEQTLAVLKFQEPFYCQNCLSKILPFQSVPNIQFSFLQTWSYIFLQLIKSDTYDVHIAHNVHNPYFSTSDTNQMFTKTTTNFSVFHFNIHSLAKKFYKLQDFVSMLNKAPSCIAISEKWLNSGSAIVKIELQNNTFIVDLTFRILTCCFLLAVVSLTWDLVCINFSFASREFVCARSTAISQ